MVMTTLTSALLPREGLVTTTVELAVFTVTEVALTRAMEGVVDA